MPARASSVSLALRAEKLEAVTYVERNCFKREHRLRCAASPSAKARRAPGRPTMRETRDRETHIGHQSRAHPFCKHLPEPRRLGPPRPPLRRDLLRAEEPPRGARLPRRRRVPAIGPVVGLEAAPLLGRRGERRRSCGDEAAVARGALAARAGIVVHSGGRRLCFCFRRRMCDVGSGCERLFEEEEPNDGAEEGKEGADEAGQHVGIFAQERRVPKQTREVVGRVGEVAAEEGADDGAEGPGEREEREGSTLVRLVRDLA